MLLSCSLNTSIGPVSLRCDADGLFLTELGFRDDAGAYGNDAGAYGNNAGANVNEQEPNVNEADVAPVLKEAARELTEYLEGRRKCFDVPYRFDRGTPFQRKVWAALADIPYGETCTYRELAERIGCPKGCRAVGNASNHNPIAIIVPCHRVIGARHQLAGYAGGLHIKRKLLDLECQNVTFQLR